MLRIIPPTTLNYERDSAFASLWNKNFIWNYQKNIFIKFFFSRLIFNLQKHKIDDLVEPTCTLCRRNRFQPLKDETLYHLILECRFYEPIVSSATNCIRNIEAGFSPHNLLLGSMCKINYERDFVNIISLLIINFTYLYRCNNPAPTINQLGRYVNGALCDYAHASKKFRNEHQAIVKKYSIAKTSFLHNDFETFNNGQ